MKIKLNNITQSYWFIIVLFIFTVGSLALEYHFHYPDEAYYTDAAIQMVQSNNYFTPYYGNGDLRFEKPILTYWIVVLGFKLFGINVFAARIFFLLSAGLLLFITNRIGFLITENKKTAYLATAIVATQVLTIMSAVRSIPDILLGLFVTFSALGFAGIIKHGNTTPKKYLWCLYLGLALAVEAKGAPALVLGIVGLMYLLFNPWKPIKVKTLFHYPSLIVSIGIASFWFVLMYLQHGFLFIDSFYNDQVGIRVSMQIWSVVKNVLLSIALLFVLHLPWSTMLRKIGFLQFKKTNTETKSFVGFVVLWILVIVFLSGFVSTYYERYLLPVTPLFSVLLALIISKNTIALNTKQYKFWGNILFVLNLFANVIALYFYISSSSTIWNILMLFAITILIITLFIWFKRKGDLLGRMVFLILMMVLNLSMLTRKISFPNEGQQISNVILEEGINQNEPIGFYGQSKTLSRLNVYLKGSYSLRQVKDSDSLNGVNSFEFIIGNKELLKLIDTNNFEIKEASSSWNSHQSREHLQGLFQGDYEKTLKEKGKKYYFLHRK